MVNPVLNRDEAMRWGNMIKALYTADDGASDAGTTPNISCPSNWRIIANITLEPSQFQWQSEQCIGCIIQSITDPSIYAILFRGTAVLLKWAEHYDFFLLSYTEPGGIGKVEEGFARMYRSLKVCCTATNKIQMLTAYIEDMNASHLTVAGHSLGGALAKLTAFAAAFYNIDTEVYTYGSPMVGDRVFTETYEQAVPRTFRIYNVPDIVPKLPSCELGYVHPESGFQVDSLNNPAIGRGITEYHKLDTYLSCIAQMKLEHDQNKERVG
ncbi:lipase family protein [Paenibacillus sp. PDC88]|uniref:lipase family protein n=1 Tax=Paenibacillus sp. PDC88 TaxID=1884375 RepID=UPI000898EBF1|nr:lipase family protein [Paenibacillus sp. PDC88]SDW71795.1 Lipase (class 3) [Paenibacillus sp. PDC88]